MEKPSVVAPEIEGEYEVEDNPYFDQHVQGEIDYLPVRNRQARAHAKALVKDEFTRSGCLRPRRCPCGGEMWWRATVGAYICGRQITVSHYAHWNGEVYGTTIKAIEEAKG